MRVVAVSGVLSLALSCTRPQPAPPSPPPPVGRDAAVVADAAVRECERVQCFRAIRCRRGGCDGPVVQTGCCPCAPGDVDDIACRGDATAPAPDVAAAPDAGARTCNIPECFRAVTCCRGSCAGVAVVTSCCPCGPGEVDAIQCGGRCGGGQR